MHQLASTIDSRLPSRGAAGGFFETKMWQQVIGHAHESQRDADDGTVVMRGHPHIAAADHKTDKTPTPNSRMENINALRSISKPGMGFQRSMMASVVARPMGTAASAPPYFINCINQNTSVKVIGDNESMITVALAHAGETREACRRLSQEELMKATAKHAKTRGLSA